jgi:hypothetical protein
MNMVASSCSMWDYAKAFVENQCGFNPRQGNEM